MLVFKGKLATPTRFQTEQGITFVFETDQTQMLQVAPCKIKKEDIVFLLVPQVQEEC